MKQIDKFKLLNVLTIFFFLLSLVTGFIFLSRITTILILCLCLSVGRLDNVLFNPMLLFSITPLSLLIYVNLGDAYMVDLKNTTWLLAIMNMYVFIIVYFFTTSASKSEYSTDQFDNQSLQIQAIVFYLISLLGIIIPAISSIVWMFSVLSMVCALKSKKKGMLFFVLFIFLMTAFGTTSKSTMLTYCITFIVCLEKYYVNNERKRKMLRFFLGLCCVFMILSFSFANKDRGNYDAKESVEIYKSRGMNWNYSEGLFMPYMYITNGWTNLQYVIETQNERTYGLWSIKPILGYLQINNSIEEKYEMTSYSTFNTFAYMTYGFKDFGYVLSVLMSVFLAVFVKKVYSMYLISESQYDVTSYILVAQATLEMFFSNHFFTQSYPFTVIILMVFVKWIVKKFRFGF